MTKDYAREMAYVVRDGGKIVALCMARPNVALDSLPEFMRMDMPITLERLQDAKSEWVQDD